MGRGGDGGSYGATTAARGPHHPVPQNTFRQDGGETDYGAGADGWDGGDAIEINTVSAIVIDNTEGAIAGGGGGGGGGFSHTQPGGGGGGAGGGGGGMGSKLAFEAGGVGGAPGRIGGNGANWNNQPGRNDYQGMGGEAGGGGSGGINASRVREFNYSGINPHGGGGGGGRILSPTATGGAGGYNGGGNGGSEGNTGQSVFAEKGGRGDLTHGWGNGAGGGGWGADGGDYFRFPPDIRSKGGAGGHAIKVISGPVTASGGVVYGKRD